MHTDADDVTNINLTNDLKQSESICNCSSHSSCSSVSEDGTGDSDLLFSGLTNNFDGKGSFDSLEQETIFITPQNISRRSSQTEYRSCDEDDCFDLKEEIGVARQGSFSSESSDSKQFEIHVPHISKYRDINIGEILVPEDTIEGMGSFEEFSFQQNENTDDLFGNTIDYEENIAKSNLLSDFNMEKTNITSSRNRNNETQDNRILKQNLAIYNDGLNEFFIFEDTSDDNFIRQQNVKCFLNDLEKLEKPHILLDDSNLEAIQEKTCGEQNYTKDLLHNDEIKELESNCITENIEKIYDCEKSKILILEKNLADYEKSLKQHQNIVMFSDDPCQMIKLFGQPSEIILHHNLINYETELKKYMNKSILDTSESILKQNIQDYEIEVNKQMNKNAMDVTSEAILQKNIQEYELEVNKHINKNTIDAPEVILQQNISDYEREVNNIMIKNTLDVTSESILRQNINEYEAMIVNHMNKNAFGIEPKVILHSNIMDYEEIIKKYMSETSLYKESKGSKESKPDENTKNKNNVVQQNLKEYDYQISAWFDCNKNSNNIITGESQPEANLSKSVHESFVSKTADEVVAEAKLVCDRILLEHNLKTATIPQAGEQTSEILIRPYITPLSHNSGDRNDFNGPDFHHKHKVTNETKFKSDLPLNAEKIGSSTNNIAKLKSSQTLETIEIVKHDTVIALPTKNQILEKDLNTSITSKDSNDSRIIIKENESRFDGSLNKLETNEDMEDDDIFKVLEMTDEGAYDEDLCSPKSSPKLMKLIQTLASGGYYEDDSENSEDDEKKSRNEEKHEKCTPSTNYQLFDENVMNFSAETKNVLEMNVKLATPVVHTKIQPDNQHNLPHLTSLYQNIHEYENNINAWFHDNNSIKTTNFGEPLTTKLCETEIRNIASKTADEVIAKAKVIYNHIITENNIVINNITPGDKQAKDLSCSQGHAIDRDPVLSSGIYDYENVCNNITEVKRADSFSEIENKEEEEAEDDIFKVLEMADERKYSEDLCSPKSSPKLLRLIQSLALSSHFEGECDISDHDSDNEEEEARTNAPPFFTNSQKIEEDGSSLCRDTIDKLRMEDKPSVANTSSIINNENNINAEISPVNTYPRPPPRKKKSISMACLQSEIDEEERIVLSSDINNSHHVLEKDIIVPPPRKNRRKRNNKFGTSYSMSDVSFIDFDSKLLEDMKSGKGDKQSISYKSDDEEYNNSLKNDSKHEIHFAAPEVSSSIVDYNMYNPRKQSQRASIVLIDDIDYANRMDSEFVARKTPYVRKKSYTFTSSDTYAKEAKEKINLKRSKSSVSEIIRKTFTFKKVNKKNDPPCMPNLVKRYIRVRKNKKNKKSKGMEVIPEEHSSPKLTKTESFASIFMGSSSENLELEKLETCVSNSLLNFPEDMSPKIHRSVSNFELLRHYNNRSNLLKPSKLKRSSSFIQLTANPKSFLKRLVTEDSTVSLNAEAIKRAQELLSKSIELGSSDGKIKPWHSTEKRGVSNSVMETGANKNHSGGLEIQKCSSNDKSGNCLKNRTANAAQLIMSRKFIINSLSSLSHLTSVRAESNSEQNFYDEKQFKAPLSLLKVKKDTPGNLSIAKSEEPLNVIYERMQADKTIIHSFKFKSDNSPPVKAIIDQDIDHKNNVVYSFPYASEKRMNKNIETLENKLTMDHMYEQDDSIKDEININEGIANSPVCSMCNEDNVADVVNSPSANVQMDSALNNNNSINLDQTEKENAEDILTSLEVLKEINNKIQDIHNRMQHNSEELIFVTQKREQLSSQTHRNSDDEDNETSDLKLKGSNYELNYNEEKCVYSEVINDNSDYAHNKISLKEDIIADYEDLVISSSKAGGGINQRAFDNCITATDSVSTPKDTINADRMLNSTSGNDKLPDNEILNNDMNKIFDDCVDNHCTNAEKYSHSTKEIDNNLIESKTDLVAVSDHDVASDTVAENTAPLFQPFPNIQNTISSQNFAKTDSIDINSHVQFSDNLPNVENDVNTDTFASESQLTMGISEDTNVHSETDSLIVSDLSQNVAIMQDVGYDMGICEQYSLPLEDAINVKCGHNEMQRSTSLPMDKTPSKFPSRKFVKISSPFGKKKFTVTWPIELTSEIKIEGDAYRFELETTDDQNHDSISMDGSLPNRENYLSKNEFSTLPPASSLPEIILRTWSERQDSMDQKLIGKQLCQSDIPAQPVLGVQSQTQEVISTIGKKEEDRTQKDRCVEVYPETIRQRQRNMAPSPNKVDIKNWEAIDTADGTKDKKMLPSVKALRNQFENGGREGSPSPTGNSMAGRSSVSSSTSSLSTPSPEVSSSHASLNSTQSTREYSDSPDIEAPVEPIYRQFQNVDQDFRDIISKPPSTIGWNPQPLLKKLYFLQQAPKVSSKESAFIDIEGYLDKLPCGRKKSTFWNAWKRRYFCAKKGVLYCYHSNQMDKLSMKLPLLGGKVEIMDPSVVSVEDGKSEANSSGMLGIDDGKGHYVVVRCSSRQDAEHWKAALESHVIDDFASQYVQPWPMPTNPSLFRDTIIIDIGSCSVRAGVLVSQATLPQIFFPSVVATNRETQRQIWGTEALLPEVRSISNVTFPIKPSHKISKFSVDLNAVSSLLQKTFADLNVDPKLYNVQLSVPRVLNPNTQTELMKILFDTFGVKGVNLTHQSILALYSYNATSGIVVDIGERIDVVPIIDGCIVDGGVSRVPYGGFRILEHLRHYLFQKNLSLLNETESYIIRAVLEMVCYCAQHYNTEKARCAKSPDNFEKHAPLSDFFPNTTQFEAFHDISLNFGRFQATEGLFNPEAWGLDHPGLHKLVHKAIQECSMDIRKEMSKSVFLAGGVSQLPGLSDRLRTELDNLTPPAVRPKVHCSPYRYHASYLGACVLAESDAFSQSKISREEWQKQGNSSLRKWAM